MNTATSAQHLALDAADEDTPIKVQPVNKRGGVWVTFGTEQYRIPPLSLGALKDEDFADKVKSLSNITGMPSKEQITTAETFVHMALVRNYPSMKLDQVQDMVDLGNMQSVLGAALGVSGFTARKAGGPSGE